MKKLLLLVAAVCMFLSGCATTTNATEKNDDYLMNIILNGLEDQSQNETAERFNARIAKAFSQFRCPSRDVFEYSAIVKIVPSLFDKEERKRWLSDINRLVAEYSNGNVYVDEIKSSQKFGLYNEDSEFYVRVYSSTDSKEYAILKKEKFLNCEEKRRYKFSIDFSDG